MRGLALTLALLLAPVAGLAQHAWSFLDPLLTQTLGIRPGEGPPKLFVDHADPNVATQGLAFFYYENRHGGNAVHHNIGYFRRIEAGWTFVAPVTGLFGHNPRDASFANGVIEVTTTTLGPNEPRCCPTQVTRWRFDPVTTVVTRLN